MGGRAFRIACLGDNCVDYYDAAGEAFFGGNPVNAAVYFCRLGEQASYLGAVGKDRFGEQMIAAVAAKGVDVSHVQVLPGTTALTHVSVEDGERILGDYEEGVMEDFALREEDYSFIAEHDLAVTGLWGHCEKALSRIRRMGVPTAFDSADQTEDPRSALARQAADIFFFSDDESSDAELKEKLMRLKADGPSLVIATRGEKGSLAFDGERFVRQGIVPCRIADTMGAGDSFIAGFLTAHLRGKDLPECMEAGAASSAVTLGYEGAWK